MPTDVVRHRPPDPDAGNGYLGAALGALCAMVLAFALVPLRTHVPNSVMALSLVVPVLGGAIVGGRAAGVICAIVAAMSFNFVFTRPYLSLRVASGADVATVVVLAVVACIAAEIGVRARRGGAAARDARSELDRMYRLAELSAGGADLDDVVSSARAELIGLFGLLDCVYEPTPTGPELPRFGNRGAFEHARLVAAGDFLLPVGGVEISVRGRGRDFGRLVLYATADTRAPIEKRLVAVAIADELGVALATGTPDKIA